MFSTNRARGSFLRLVTLENEQASGTVTREFLRSNITNAENEFIAVETIEPKDRLASPNTLNRF